jgi:signal transduction histidine kinase/ligand-binding sensor domain-containing protein
MPLTIALLALVLSAGSSAMTPFVSDVWGTKEGLPQSSVTAVVQTSDGYLWLGTLGGLVRFDGVKFELFTPSTHRGLPSSRIRALHQDRHQRLWIGTEDGGLVMFEHGVFTPFESPQLSLSTISFIADAPDGGLWVSSLIGLVEIRGGTTRQHRRADGSLLTPESNMVEHDGALWFGTRWGLVRYGTDGVRTFTTADGLPHDAVRTLLKSRDGSLWVGTDGGLIQWIDGALVTRYAGELTTPQITTLREDAAGRLWIGTKAGLNVLSQRTVTPFRSPGALGSDPILSITDDREGNVWVGTVMHGLARVKPARVSMLYPNPGHLVGVVPITEDREGRMWVGATCSGLVRYDGDERRVFTNRDGLPPDCIWSLLADRDGSMWVGTWGGGLARMRPGAVDIFNHRNGALTHDVVLSLFQDRNGVVWIGTFGGLHAFRGGVFQAYRTADGLVHDDVRFITEERSGALWIGTTNGVSRFAGGRFTNYTTRDGLSHDSVRAIHEDADGTIWIGTYGGGLTRFRDGRFAAIRQRDGLFDDVVSRILEDDRGFLWMSGNRGIFRVGRAALNDFADGKTGAVTSISYGSTDGMKNRETNGGGQPAGWRSRDGRLWFPTIDGVAIIDATVPDNQLSPPIVIERVAVDDRPLNLGEPIVVPAGRTRLEIQYAGLSLVAPDKAQFRYRLEGYDTASVDAGTRRTAYYTNLPPGQYTFRAIGSNNDGVWNNTGATLQIVVPAPFWMTWWFRLSIGFTLLVAALIVHRTRVSRLERRQHEHEAFTRGLIESQEAERARIARELHDTIGQSLVLIKHQALRSVDKGAGDHAAAAINDISAMATQAIAEVKEIAYDLRPYQLDRLGLTKALDALVARVESSTTLHVETRIARIDGVLSKAAEITLYRIIQESLNNIVKHAHATRVNVEIDHHEGVVRTNIRDDGAGFNVAAATHPPRGMGLAGISERAGMLGAALDIDSLPGRGTSITITIPAHSKQV